jgi:Tfp pilus assembly protein PilF
MKPLLYKVRVAKTEVNYHATKESARIAGQERNSEALHKYRAALALKPDFPEAHNNMGNMLHGEGELQASIESYERAFQVGDFGEFTN